MSSSPQRPSVSLPSVPGFSSSRTIPLALDDLTPVAEDVMEHFRVQGYDVTGERLPSRGWHISLAKGTVFAAVLGLKTALNIELQPTSNATVAKAGIGIFGRQVVPALIARFVAWPVWLTQIWGLVQQAQLDDEALDAVERSLRAHASRATVTPVSPAAAGGPAGAAARADRYCTECGAALTHTARFCSACGARS